MSPIDEPLPDAFLAVVGTEVEMRASFQGMGSHTRFVTSPRGDFVVKHSRHPRAAAALAAEQRVLHALAEWWGPVPEPLGFVLEGGQGWSLMTRVPGRNLVETLGEADEPGRQNLVVLVAESLRTIHSWSPNLPRPAVSRDPDSPSWFARAVDRAEHRLREGHIENPIIHPGRYLGDDPTTLVARLQTLQPEVDAETEPEVFCHRDPCMPNFLTESGRATGVVDWSDAGYADRRIDLAIACWSIAYNLEDIEYQRLFLRTYGYGGDLQSLEPFEALYALT